MLPEGQEKFVPIIRLVAAAPRSARPRPYSNAPLGYRSCSHAGVMMAVVPSRWALARQYRAYLIESRLVRWRGRLEVGGPTLHSALQRVIDRRNPTVHVFFRRRLVYTSELRCYDFKAEPSFCVSCFSDRGHPEIDRVHVKVKLLLPVAVFRELALVENDPESEVIISIDLRVEGVNRTYASPAYSGLGDRHGHLDDSETTANLLSVECHSSPHWKVG